MLRVLVLACAAFLVIAAPVQQVDKPLVRTKRSEEAIMFGNHQNFARTKKGDLHPKPFNSLAEDASAEQKDSTEDSHEKSEESKEVMPETEQANKSGESENVQDHSEDRNEDEEEQIEKLLTSNTEVDPLTASEDKAEEERILERLMKEKQHPGSTRPQVPSDGLQIAHPERVLEPEDKAKEEEASGEAESSQEDSKDYKDYIQPYYNTRDYEEDSLLFPPSLFKSYREKRSTLGKGPAVTAEDMMSAGAPVKKLTGRVKRDLPLSPEQLEDILRQNYYGDTTDYEEYPQYFPEVERRAADDYNREPEFVDNVPDEMPAFDIDPRSYDKPMYYPEDTEDNEFDPEEEQERRLELLEYLYDTQDGGPSYSAGSEYPGDFEESWQDLGPAREVRYEYEDEMEPPPKRQYLSFVPGVKREWNDKREADFYPYQFGPDGRWGALVANPEMEKRNEMAEYERLYELAQALNGPRESEGGYYDKRFDFSEPSLYNDYDRRRK